MYTLPILILFFYMEETPISLTRKKFHYSMWIVLLLLSMSAVGVYIWIVRGEKEDSVSESIPYTPPSELNVSSTIQTVNEEEVRARFDESIQALVQEVEAHNGDVVALLSRVEEKMLTIRFPGAVREQYMTAFLVVEKLKEQQQPLDSVKSEIVRVLGTLK